ncbi:MAG: cell wall metabolism sensor histidine kinase WalK [Deltaproteobacteria bacterium]|nr:cell wall metabolism sensor histidine kinase WalK [Deltaproteobacteria bacterium]
MARKKKLFWQLYPSYLLIILMAVVAVTWYASSAVKHFLLQEMTSDLEARARLLENQVVPHLHPLHPAVIDRLAKNMGKQASTRITILLPSGQVVGDSHEDPASMDNHVDRLEIQEAIRNGLGQSIRFSRTLGHELMYVAWAVKREGRVKGIIRTAIPLRVVDQAVQTIQGKIVLCGAIIAVFATLVSLFVSRRITRPVEEIRGWSESIAKGDFQRRPEVSAPEEIEALSASLAYMADELRKQIDMVVRQRNEIQAMFSSMAEGVFALDMDECIISMNRTAEEMLSCNFKEVKGRSIQEVARNLGLHQFVKEALTDPRPLDKDILISPEEGVVLNCQGSILKDSQDRQIGVMVVLNDVSRLRRLENVRREFVANVSHEIKTPITAIKGFVETLMDGAAQDPRDSERFLKIINTHVNRLEAILEDLLSLSRVEEDAEKQEIQLVQSRLDQVLATAMQICEDRAGAKAVRIEVACPETMVAEVDPPLLEQAVVNLLDNAIKYSPDQSVIRMQVTRQDNEIRIAVRDQGCGIPKKHLARIFERFYRVDKARSRQLGGTGLGLAIVKHIAEAHAGRVSVESTPGKGSTFTIHLPV